ncbi:hypothetical protein [Actinokineospora cianjurensis]|uniref:Uncharacterized protein n=1 Tax=Actinokineospora cianjurensis TaxID=585224 RepID=A0A421B3B8_9PSEU|nr:hypothetical protein [Actinokineospora cianjurensis]RLK58926.1 hypothetical protein CLV68_3407 [Actinokineospora cianjurensis]
MTLEESLAELAEYDSPRKVAALRVLLAATDPGLDDRLLAAFQALTRVAAGHVAELAPLWLGDQRTT